jgi:methylated-DNA-protein-cysteine methyltransferase-like protein
MARAKKSFNSLFRPHVTARHTKSSAADAQHNPVLQAIWDVIAMIPAGQVSTYGNVARAAGLPRGARQAGYALRVAPDGMNLPWHRIVGAGGRIAFPKGSTHFREQTRRLRAEGVKVVDGKVDTRAIALLD